MPRCPSLMSDLVGTEILYDAPASEGNARTVFEALRAAVEANWERFADPWSSPSPEPPVAVEAWVERVREPANFDFEQWGEDARRYGFQETEEALRYRPIRFDFAFSPVSPRQMTLDLRYHTDGRLSVHVYVSERAFKTEGRLDRERLRLQEESGLSSSSEVGRGELAPALATLETLGPLPKVTVQNWHCLLHISATLLSALPARFAMIDDGARNAW